MASGGGDSGGTGELALATTDDVQEIDRNQPIEGTLVHDDEVGSAPLLEVKIIEGLEDAIGQCLQVNAQGLVGSKRNKKDGCTIIGSLEVDPASGEYFNDYVIPNEDVVATGQGGIGKRHMVIKYNDADKMYYLRDLGEGSGTFIRVDNHRDLVLKHGFIVSFGDSHMVI